MKLRNTRRATFWIDNDPVPRRRHCLASPPQYKLATFSEIKVRAPAPPCLFLCSGHPEPGRALPEERSAAPGTPRAPRPGLVVRRTHTGAVEYMRGRDAVRFALRVASLSGVGVGRRGAALQGRALLVGPRRSPFNSSACPASILQLERAIGVLAMRVRVVGKVTRGHGGKRLASFLGNIHRPIMAERRAHRGPAGHRAQGTGVEVRFRRGTRFMPTPPPWRPVGCC